MTTAKQKLQLQHSIHPSHFGTEFRSEWPPAGSSSQQKTSEKHMKTHKAPTTQTAMIRFEDFQHPTCSAKEHGVSGVFAHGSVCSTFHHCPNAGSSHDTISSAGTVPSAVAFSHFINVRPRSLNGNIDASIMHKYV